MSDGIYNTHSEYLTRASVRLARIRFWNEQIRYYEQELENPGPFTNKNLSRARLSEAHKQLENLK